MQIITPPEHDFFTLLFLTNTKLKTKLHMTCLKWDHIAGICVHVYKCLFVLYLQHIQALSHIVIPFIELMTQILCNLKRN